MTAIRYGGDITRFLAELKTKPHVLVFGTSSSYGSEEGQDVNFLMPKHYLPTANREVVLLGSVQFLYVDEPHNPLAQPVEKAVLFYAGQRIKFGPISQVVEVFGNKVPVYTAVIASPK